MTTLEEQHRRQEEFKKVASKFEEYVRELSKVDDETKEKILESPEYKKVSRELALGPVYDIPLADIESQEYHDAFGKHPLDYSSVRSEYELGIYGKHVKFSHYGSGVVECLAYDYGDFYYKFIPDDSSKILYITLISPYESD